MNLSTINSRINLLRGLHLAQMPRHIWRELVIAANCISAAHADALLKATPPEQRTDCTSPRRPSRGRRMR